MKQLSLKISHETGRLDLVITKLVPELSRSKTKELIDDRHILVNEKTTKANYQVHEDDHIDISIPDVKPLDAIPQNIPLAIVYEDDDVIVVNKPQGMVVHPSAGHPDQTLVNGLLYHAKLADNGTTFRPGIVHRIDKDTSGLLMVAKTQLARESLEAQLRAKTNKREYLAIVHGNFAEKSGTIDAPLGRSKKDRKKQAVVADGRSAITHFKVLEQFRHYALIKCVLETGRTHQIRVHLQYIGHPVAGDPLYAPKKTLPGKGQFLHAATLGFVHPRTKKWLEFHVDPPAIFQAILTKLRQQ